MPGEHQATHHQEGPIVDRRLFLTASAALALAACSSNSSSSGSASSSTSSSSSSGFPVTVTDAFGDVTIEKAPTRVVALGWGDAEDCLQLGVQPVGASDWLGFGGNGVGPWLKDAYDTAPTLIETMEPSYEKIAALKPDLILDVKSSGDKTRHDKLKQIAPVVGVPKGGENYLTSPANQLALIAKALGKQAEGTRLQKALDAKFAAAAAAHPGWKGLTASALTLTSQGWGAYIKGGDRLDFLQKLGFARNSKLEALTPDATGFSTSLSAEKLSLADADLVVAFPIYVKTTQVTGSAAFKAIPAVKKGHDVVIDGDLSNAFSLGSPAAQTYALQNLVPKIATALAK